MAGATVQVGSDAATTTAVVSTAEQVDPTTQTTDPVDPWDKKLKQLLAEQAEGGDGTDGDGSNAGADGEGAAEGGEAGAGDGTKPQGEGVAAGGKQRRDRTDTVPIDRFETVVAQRNELAKKVNELAGNANYEAGRADALEEVVTKTGTAAKDDSGIPDDPLEIIEQACGVYDKQFEEGQLSASDWRKKIREAEDLRRSLIAENDRKERDAKAQTDAKAIHEQILADPDLIEADRQLHADHPWVASIPAKVLNELIIPAAHESLGKLAPTAKDTIRLHQAIYQEAIDLGLQRKYDKTAAKGDTQTATTTKASTKPPVVTGEQRAAKADLATKHPPAPGIGAAGASAESSDSASTGEITMAAYERMTAEQRKAYMVKMGALPAG